MPLTIAAEESPFLDRESVGPPSAQQISASSCGAPRARASTRPPGSSWQLPRLRVCGTVTRRCGDATIHLRGERAGLMSRLSSSSGSGSALSFSSF
jgi:hypothetical protein